MTRGIRGTLVVKMAVFVQIRIRYTLGYKLVLLCFISQIKIGILINIMDAIESRHQRLFSENYPGQFSCIVSKIKWLTIVNYRE